MLPESVQNIFEAENEEDCNCKRKKRLLDQFSQKVVAMMFGKWPPVVSRKYRKSRSDLNATHLLRTVIANSDVECIGRARTPTIN